MDSNRQPLRDEAAQARFYYRHKQLFTSVVMPVILATTVFLVLTHMANTWKFWSALAVAMALDVFNVYFSRKQRLIKTPFGTFDSRSDTFDTFRWCVNLPFDVYVLWALGLDFASASFMWLILTFGAMTEIFGARNRLITVSVAFGCFVVMTQTFEAAWPTKLYVLSCYLGIVFILFRFERWLFEEMRSYYEVEQAQNRIAQEASLLQRQAVIGNQARTICHEINNLLSILQMSVGRLHGSKSRKNADDERKLSVKRMERALEKLTRLSQVVLSEVGVHHDVHRFCEVAQLVMDLEMLLARQFGARTDIVFEMILPKKRIAAGQSFREATGTTYLIVHNLVKNAAEAVANLQDGRLGEVKLELRVDGDRLLISVTDNGNGFSLSAWRDITSGKAISDKHEGHGLGLRFVLEQVELNGMKLTMESKESRGTTFWLSVPLVAVVPEGKAA